MTDLPDDIEASLTQLGEKQAESHRAFRRVTLLAAGAFLLLALLDAILVLIGAIRGLHDPWVYRNLITIGGLTGLGLMGHMGAARAFQVVVQRDAEVLEGLRKQAMMAAALDEMRPLMAAIEEARIKGVPLLIPPGSVELPPHNTVH